MACLEGIGNSVCRLGKGPSADGDGDFLLATLAHRVAHAYRTTHRLVRVDSEQEEQLSDLTAVYLGFGLLALNGTDRDAKAESLGSDAAQFREKDPGRSPTLT